MVIVLPSHEQSSAELGKSVSSVPSQEVIDEIYEKAISDYNFDLNSFDEAIKLTWQKAIKDERKRVLKMIKKLIVKFKSIDEQDKFHMKGWNDALNCLKDKLK